MTERTAPRPAAGWFTSSYSNQGNGCVQVRFEGGAVLLGDSKHRGAGPVIRLTGPDWDDFVVATLGAAPVGPATLTITPTATGGRTVTAADGTALTYTAAEWTAFLAGAADGEFTRPPAAAHTA